MFRREATRIMPLILGGWLIIGQLWPDSERWSNIGWRHGHVGRPGSYKSERACEHELRLERAHAKPDEVHLLNSARCIRAQDFWANESLWRRD